MQNCPSKHFHTEMQSNSISLLNALDSKLNVYWGEDVILDVPQDIVSGYCTSAIQIEHYNDTKFAFPLEYKADFNAFISYSDTQKILHRKDNMHRFMVTSYTKNHNSHNEIISFTLQHTDYLQNTFARDCYVKAPDKIMPKMLFNSSFTWSNSFCLHLIIQTKDNKIVLGRTAIVKKDDYPGTWAVTIGEQLELSDFYNNGSYENDFVIRWVKRAISEEFGIFENNFDEIFDIHSVKVLGTTYEANIGNYALATVISSNYKYSDFNREISELIQRQEISEYTSINIADIPKILVNYKNNCSEYHPSSYIRLLLIFLHYNGFNRGYKRIVTEAKHEKLL
jgi:hypothetical protein